MSSLLLSSFDSTAGWTLDSGITVEADGFDFKEGTGSVAIDWPVTSTNKTATNTFAAFTVTDYTELVLAVKTRNGWKVQGAPIPYSTLTDFWYKLELIDTSTTKKTWYLPLREGWTDLRFSLSGLTGTANKVKVTALTANKDTLWVDDLRAVSETMPLDALAAIRDGLQSAINTEIGNGFLVGTMSAATAGASSVTVATANYVQVGSLVRIKEGATTEDHIIAGGIASRALTFGDQHQSVSTSGRTVANTFTSAASVYVCVPVRLAVDDMIVVPGVSITGAFEPGELPANRSARDIVLDSYTATGVDVYERGEELEWVVQVALDAIGPEILQKTAKAIRGYLRESGALRVNGGKVGWALESTEMIEATESDRIIPRAIWMLRVNLLERSHTRETKLFPAISTITVTTAAA